MSFFGRFSTPVFKNTGSTARDHLASERTYLAWMRTGLGFLALGIGVERFNQLDLAEILPTKHKKRFHEDKTHNDKSDALVGALLGSGAGSIAYGTTRYFSNMRLLEQGLFKPAFHGAAFLAVGVAGIAGAVYWSTVRERKANSSHYTQVHMAAFTTPPGLPDPDSDSDSVSEHSDGSSSTTEYETSPMSNSLEATVFRELTDRRHNPPSPDVGYAKFSPVPYPYMPSRRDPDIHDDEPQVMMLAATHDPEVPGGTENFEEGYPNASSPISRRITRAAKKLQQTRLGNENVSAFIQPPETSIIAIESPKQPTTAPSPAVSAEDQAVNNNVVPRLYALTLHTTPNIHTPPQHLDSNPPSSSSSTLGSAYASCKAKIINAKSVRGFRFPSPRVSKPKKPKSKHPSMHTLAKWAGQDKEKQEKVAALLHARTEVRTKGLENPC
ncbi:hypothetical protein E4T42_03088 [Aureobasidium subglaciale]|nr:hypothetical protein E4T42_03088 [Aureobasidium subglaciale]